MATKSIKLSEQSTFASFAKNRRLSRRLYFLSFGFLAASGPLLNILFDAPDFVRWLDSVLIVIGFLYAFSQLSTGHRGSHIPFVCLFAFSFVCVMSALINSVSLDEMVVGWRSLLLFYLFYLLAVLFQVDGEDVMNFFITFLATVFVHSIIAFQQFLSVGNLAGFDDITGGYGVGTANLFGYTCALSILVCISLGWMARSFRYLIFAPTILGAWVMSSSQGSYIVFVISVMLMIVLTLRTLNIRSWILFVVFLVSIPLIFRLLPGQFQNSIEDIFLSGSIAGLNSFNVDDAGNPGRLRLLFGTLELVSASPTEFLFGVGTGTVASRIGTAFSNNFLRLAVLTGATFVPSSLVQFLAEIGVLGLGVIMFSITQVFWIAWKVRNKCEQSFQQTWLLLAIALVPFFILGSVGEVVWTFRSIAYPFWLLAAYAIVLSEQSQQTLH